VQVSLGLRSAQWAELTVRDHGPGIPSAQDRARLMLPFQRGEQGRGTPGTGLGLAIVARVAERCGGRLLLEEAAPGLRAVLLLPVQPARP
jgi:signal transduction histidine kinase